MKTWKEQATKVRADFAQLATKYPDMIKAYKALGEAQKSTGLDKKTIELISIAVAVTTRCHGCIAVHAQEASRLGATEAEIAGAISTAITLNAGAAYVYGLNALEAYNENQNEDK